MQIIQLEKFQSINANYQRDGLSEKYCFVPTTRVINTLVEHGWQPVKANEVRARKHKIGFQKHLIRFRQDDGRQYQKDDIIPEIVLFNSHDGSASFQISAGLFRMICANGLVVADSTFKTHRIKHLGYREEDVSLAIENVIKNTPRIMNKVEQFKEISLSKDEQMIYLDSALLVKYNEEQLKSIPSKELFLKPLRQEDAALTLWNTYNSIQEKFINGFSFRDGNRYNKIRKNRGISNISENVRINKALWQLAEKMAEIKAAA